jgi:hypothetical protein
MPRHALVLTGEPARFGRAVDRVGIAFDRVELATGRVAPTPHRDVFEARFAAINTHYIGALASPSEKIANGNPRTARFLVCQKQDEEHADRTSKRF